MYCDLQCQSYEMGESFLAVDFGIKIKSDKKIQTIITAKLSV